MSVLAAMVSLDQSHDLIRSIIAKDNTSVKDMRRIISKMRALVYRDEDECRGKKKRETTPFFVIILGLDQFDF